ncbi:hypothetical protein O181_115055 [Austropuccinia psidii MF-1]|uniref:Uncharacterized protein n=1 Tax=Austropuccinia psidii MF-1 TaxID=1389203 RepID=A0A9Q3K5P0_9BASI|nr:hypothetical protein [Austropuccinia psidii MF-1]
MSSGDHFYGSCSKDFIHAFPSEEVERMIFGDPSPPSRNTSLLDWALALTRDPSSPPALATLSKASSPSPSSEGVPEAAMAFYAFIEGEYDPRLFVPDPLSYFLGEETPSNGSIKANCGYKKHFHHYNLHPHDSSGWAITAPR